MSDRQDLTLHRVILATKTYEIRYNIDPNGADEEAEENLAAAPTPSPDAQLTPVPPLKEPSPPEESSPPSQ